MKDFISTLLSGPISLFFKPSLPTVNSNNLSSEKELVHPETAKITRCARGVPHCTAGCEADLWFLNGICHGQDRLWQLHSARMLAAGRLSEFAGRNTLDVDRLARRLGFRNLAEHDLTCLETGANEGDSNMENALRMLRRYCAGINWAVGDLAQMPVEFWATGQRRAFEGEEGRWTALDALSIARLYSFVMSFGAQHTLLRCALYDIFGSERAAEWCGMSEVGDGFPPTVGKETMEAFRRTGLRAASPSKDLVGTLLKQGEGGSNSWVISGDRTDSGLPMLLGDPHLSIKLPQFWYEIGLKAPADGDSNNFDAYGCAPVGFPGVFVGKSLTCAWSITLGYCDVEDVFLEEVRKRDDGKHEYLHSEGVWQSCGKEVVELIKVKDEKNPVSCLCLETRDGRRVLDGDGAWLSLSGLVQDRIVSKTEGQETKLAYAGIPLRVAEKKCSTVTLRQMLLAKKLH